MQNEKLLTTKQLAARFQVTRHTIRKWRINGELPFIKIDRVTRFRESDVEKFEKAKIVNHA